LSNGEECHGKSAEFKVGGKLWFVKLIRHQPGPIRFGKGWQNLKEENIMEIGDTCFF
jgi:hypothetical protein